MRPDWNLKPWWRTDDYSEQWPAGPFDQQDASLWGPKGPAAVELYPDDRTQPGWGRSMFMPRYLKGHFGIHRFLHPQRPRAFAWVMRGMNALVVDIDGKNQGFDGVAQLGYLPETAAEISKSGNGYHLFYRTEDEWDPHDGFGLFPDKIGIAPGVDIRGVGCVYHYPAQRWNTRELAPLPGGLATILSDLGRAKAQAARDIRTALLSDPEEVLIMQNALLDELARPIPVGKRNNTLFAIGSKLKLAQVPNWEEALDKRASAVGLDGDEIVKLIDNINKYA